MYFVCCANTQDFVPFLVARMHANVRQGCLLSLSSQWIESLCAKLGSSSAHVLRTYILHPTSYVPRPGVECSAQFMPRNKTHDKIITTISCSYRSIYVCYISFTPNRLSLLLPSSYILTHILSFVVVLLLQEMAKAVKNLHFYNNLSHQTTLLFQALELVCFLHKVLHACHPHAPFSCHAFLPPTASLGDPAYQHI